MRLSSRRSDDADVIRARLRVLLDERGRSGGWLPDDLEDLDELPGVPEEDPDDLPSLPGGMGRHRAPDRAQRWNPGRHGARSLWAVGLTAALVLVTWTWWERPRVEPAPEQPAASVSHPGTPPVGEVAETSTAVVVSVVGPVGRPGLVTLPVGARVAEAVDAAGGMLAEADPTSVNLAAVLVDGEQVVVGLPGAASGGAGDQVAGPGTAGAATPGSPVNLNTAGVPELDALPGIGPVLAQRIVDHRNRAGPFRSVAALDDVPGIGPAIAAELAGLVRV